MKFGNTMVHRCAHDRTFPCSKCAEDLGKTIAGKDFENFRLRACLKLAEGALLKSLNWDADGNVPMVVHLSACREALSEIARVRKG